jgi:hypothetical protein
VVVDPARSANRVWLTSGERGLIGERVAEKVLQKRLHDQLQALCPGLSAPAGHGRALALPSPMVLMC